MPTSVVPFREGGRLMMTEKGLLEVIRTLAKLTGWMVYHTHDSRHSEAGFPDLVLLRPPRLIFAELKGERGRLTDAQADWLFALGRVGGPQFAIDDEGHTTVGAQMPEVYLWTPRQWRDGSIEAQLK